MRYVPLLDVVDTPVGRGRPPTLRRSLEEARGRSPGCRSRKRLGTRLRAPLLLKSSIITSSPPLAGMLSFVLRRSAGRVRGSLSAEAAARRCCFRASASSSRAGGPRNRLPGSVRSSGRRAAVTPVFVHRPQPDGLRLPGDPLFSSPGLAGSSATRGGSPQAWHGLAGCPEASRLLCSLLVESAAPLVPFLLSCHRRPPRRHESGL